MNRLVWIVWISIGWKAAAADEVARSAPAIVPYREQIQPLLQRYCVRCHGPEKRESGLRLDSGTELRRGGDGGEVVVPGDLAASRLLIAITGGNDEVSSMPPEGEAPSAAEVALIRSWIEQGVKVPEDDEVVRPVTDHWAFRGPVAVPLPGEAFAAPRRNAIDAFVLAKLAGTGLQLSPEADRPTLIRRLSLDLLGLPPSAEEVAEFVADDRPDAYERLVDRLLASPAYGERWGRHWLDAARYADSNGYTRDFGREIWKYREWVIQAINADLPFDEFTIQQFAGDMLPDPTQDQLIATGFHRNTLINEEGGTDQEQFRVDAVADRLATTGEVFLGLTLGCARCHSHKYDPISQREFYQLFAFLNNCDEPSIEVPSEHQVARGDLARREEIRKQIQELEKEVESRRPELEAKQRAWEKTITPMQRARLPGPVQVAFDMDFEKRDAANKKTIEDYYRQSEVGRQDFPLLDEIARLREAEPKIPKTMVLKERSEPRKTHVHRRGDFLDLGEEVTPAVPAVLHPLPKSTGSVPSRLDLACWLVSPENPLTPRVIANRFWQQFFGHGIVETDNDFGTQGTPPTHPELLDWLALEFLRDGWSVKQLHREIVLSATYRQSSAQQPEAVELDPYNRLLARQSRLRLEAEVIRDSALVVAGLLTRKLGGPSVYPPQPEGVFDFTQDPKPWPTATGEDRYRRGLYTFFWRTSPYPALMVFDAPNANVSCTRRLRSNTPLQALTLANDVQFLECAVGLARRVTTESSAETLKRLDFAFQTCFARDPSPVERKMLAELLAAQQRSFAEDPAAAAALLGIKELQQADAVELASWTAVCRVLLNLDEFITRE